MKRLEFPLLGRMLFWLTIHLLVLTLTFGGFIIWQLQLGLDSFLSGAAGARLGLLGNRFTDVMVTLNPVSWDHNRDILLAEYGVEGGVLEVGGSEPIRWQINTTRRPPDEIVERAVRSLRRPLELVEVATGAGVERGNEEVESAHGLIRKPAQAATPLFLTRAAADGSYWAAVELPIRRVGEVGDQRHVLLLGSDKLGGGGLFFEVLPWAHGLLLVMSISLVVWSPFFVGLTQYIKRLSATTRRIADGEFDARVGMSRRDELGSLGDSIDVMAERLQSLVNGQKRFLADVAHELCSPIARIRTALALVDRKVRPENQARIASIDEDAASLSELVAELLAFTRAQTAPDMVRLRCLELSPLINELIDRECADSLVKVDGLQGLSVKMDERLLRRALVNVLRNAVRHVGAGCKLDIGARAIDGDKVELTIADQGCGVDEAELSHIFRPFYRPDSARTRERGGSGLGLAIVQAAVEACDGSVFAKATSPEATSQRGLSIVFILPRCRS